MSGLTLTMHVSGASVAINQWIVRRAARASRVALVLTSTSIVATLVTSIVIGPIGGRVLAQDGYGKRDREGGGILATLLGSTKPDAELDPTRHVEPAHWRRYASFSPRLTARHLRWLAQETNATRLHHPDAATATPVALANTHGTPVFRQAVCVRLCDGYYFPMGALQDRADADRQAPHCGDLCPGAPTRLFVTAGGVDEIDKATALGTGQRYQDLPMAFAHTKEVGPTCACHPPGQEVAAAVSPMRDTTLRTGDSIMTPVGWRVFQGADHWPYRRGDFTTIRAATNLPARTKSTLARLEDASLGRRLIAGEPRPLLVTPRVRIAAATPPAAADARPGLAGAATLGDH